uniref:SER_THR_PHOSPHATASE domain-containing protein n=1 Tax=Meloidogyne hapla TaxID=6305 RepID=A0A1I8BW83_MELHA
MANDNTARTAVSVYGRGAGASTAARASVGPTVSTNSGDSAKQPTFIFDRFLERHLRYTKKRIVYHPSEITTLCLTAEVDFKKHYKDESCVVKIKRLPLYIVGDIHGNWRQLLRVFNVLGLPGDKAYLFLGDYINAYYGFREELKTRFNLGDADSVYKHINSVFRYLPLCAVVAGEKILLKALKLPRDIVAQQRDTTLPKNFFPQEHPLDLDILWADPNGDVDGFEYNEARQSSVWFGPQEVYATCERLGVKLIVRAHQAFNRGFGFFAGKRLVTLFGATDYVVKGSFAGILHLQLGKAQDKKGNPNGKDEIQAGIILFRPATKETKGKQKFIQEYENFPEAEEDEETQLEILGKVNEFFLVHLKFVDT